MTMPGQVGQCGRWVDGEACGRLASVRYLAGWFCPAHTPAALAGRPEPTPDPVAWAATVTPKPRTVKAYGSRTIGPGKLNGRGQ